MANPAPEEKRKSKGRFSLAKRFSSKKKTKKRQSKNGNVSTEGSSEFVSSSGSFHETSEELMPEPQAQHEEPILEESQEKHQPEKKDRRKSKHQKKGTSGNHPKKSDTKDSAKKRASTTTKLQNGRVPDQSNAPASAYGLDKQSEGKQVQYTVNEKGESVQFSINQKGVPELWLQVDHDQCLVSPMTINSSSFAPASSSSLSTTQQSLDNENGNKKHPMSNSKQDLFMKTSLLTIGGKEKHGVPHKQNSLMGEHKSESDEDSIAAEEQLLNQVDDNYKKASELPPKPKGKKKANGKKKKKGAGKKEKKKKKSDNTMSGDEDDRISQPQSSSVVPSAKIPSLEERSSIKLPAANKNGKSGKKIKRKSEKIKSKDKKTIDEEKQQAPESPTPPSPPPEAEPSPPSSGGGGGTGGDKRRIVRRIQRIQSVPASGFSSPTTSSPDPNDTASNNNRRISSATITNRKSASSSPSTTGTAIRSSTYESPKRMSLKALRKRFGAQQSETFLTLSPSVMAAANYGEMKSDLQTYGRPSDQRNKRPGLKRKEYQMSQRSMRHLELESSGSDDDEDGNLVEYLRNSNYKLDI